MKLLASLILSIYSISSIASTCGDIKLLSAIDGDTIKAEMVGVSPKLKSVSIRIRGIDTPELHRFKCDKEKQDAQRAKEYVQSELEIAKSVELKNLAWDKFGGRILADVYVDGSNLSTKILIQGLAVKYYGKKKVQDWCQ